VTRTPIHHVDWRADQYIGGTFGVLSIEEHGLYIVVLSAIYSTGGPVPNDLGYFTHACKGTHWRTVKAALAGLVDKGKLVVGPDGRLSNGRAERELWAARDRVHNSARAAQEAGKAHTRNARGRALRPIGNTLLPVTTPSRRADAGKISSNINGPAEPRGAHHQPPLKNTDLTTSTDAARDPAPDQTAPGRAPAKIDPRLEAAALRARAKLLKGEP
jgi:uncharacterized protein YdaU (DUF1376 family)